MTAPDPANLRGRRRCPPQITKAFTDFKLLGIERVTLVNARARNVHLCRLAGYKGDATEAPYWCE